MNASSIILTKINREDSEYYAIHRLPTHIMKSLIENFKNIDFLTRYKKYCSLIKACNDPDLSAEDSSSYWALNQNNGKDLTGKNPHDWSTNSRIHETERIVLNGILELLKDAITIATGEKAGTNTMIPGFVTTGKAVH